MKRARSFEDTNLDSTSGAPRTKRLLTSETTAQTMARPKSHNDYTVGWICALPKEQTAAVAMLDRIHDDPLAQPESDHNTYYRGEISNHNIVITCLPNGMIGTNQAAVAVTHITHTFPSIKVGLLVGIGGGIPPKVRLGDVVVSKPEGGYPGVVQWDLGKAEVNGNFKRTGALNNPPRVLLTALSALETNHPLYGSKVPKYLHEMETKWPGLKPKYTRSESLKDPVSTSDEVRRGTQIHYGLIASGNKVIKDSEQRDRLNKDLGGNVLCVEMEAAGLVDFPCIVIRGICDYADAEKKDDWQEYAAAVAAAYAKELLGNVRTCAIKDEAPIKDILVDDRVARIIHETESDKDHKILNWLAPFDYSLQQSDYFKRRQPGTGQWLLDSEEYQDWIEQKAVLFCPGIPGAGKTLITSIVVNDLRTRFFGDSTTATAYIYCNFNRKAEQETDRLLANLLKQLTWNYPSLPDSVRKLYDRYTKHGTERPQLRDIIEVLHSISSAFSRVFFVVDALDECESPSAWQAEFLSELFALHRKYGLNIFATSRPIQKVIDKFKGITHTKLEIQAHNEDVRNYLDGQISGSDKQLLKKHSNYIISVISNAVCGM
ncbi:hypothetical protein TWF730_002886 [Orbilia blumenaviensis]|uniref:Nucleoside phosphorylase domain-containing protein n=1 Tax=Orbilia blumenaviensis TaxID=1796055 RepID=A0AAV9U8Z5_9PEZI